MEQMKGAVIPMPLSPGICSVTFRALGVDAVVFTATEAGLAGIEWGSDVHVHAAGSTASARTATLAAGLRIMSLGLLPCRFLRKL